MSKPMPAHHVEITIPRRAIVNGYNVPVYRPHDRTTWMIVAASPVNLPPDEKLPADGWVRVIVAPARVPT